MKREAFAFSRRTSAFSPFTRSNMNLTPQDSELKPTDTPGRSGHDEVRLGQRDAASRDPAVPGGSAAARFRAGQSLRGLLRVDARLPPFPLPGPLRHGFWLGPAGRKLAALRRGSRNRPPSGPGRLHRDDRRRPRHDGGRQPRSQGRRRGLGGLQHQTGQRAKAQRLCRSLDHVQPFLRPQVDAGQILLSPLSPCPAVSARWTNCSKWPR